MNKSYIVTNSRIVKSLAIAAIMAAGIAFTASAQSAIKLSFLGRYSSNTYDAGGTEISAYDPATKRLFSVNGFTGDLDIINMSNPVAPALITTIDLSPYGAAANSVAAKNGIIVAGVEAVIKQDPGKAVFFDANGTYLNQVTVGALPDMLMFTPDGSKVLVANEGEPNTSYTSDPEGSVTIIDLSAGVMSATATQVSFSAWNDFSTSFETGVDPSGWSNFGAYYNNVAGQSNTGTFKAGLNSLGDWIMTGSEKSPKKLSFYGRASGATSNYGIAIEVSPNGTTWTAVDTIFANGSNTGDVKDTYQQFTFNLNLSTPHYIRWNMIQRIGGSLYLDDVTITHVDRKEIRVFGVNATVAQDLEPEYIAVSDNSQTAWVTLQENNALGIIDINTGTVLDLKGLGYKDHNLSGNGMDASDQNSGIINIASWPVKGMYQPDAIASFRYNGSSYFIAANEGDVREYTALTENARVSTLALDPAAFPNAATLKTSANLGRLNVTNKLGDTDNDGDFDELYSFGSRSFSIRDSAGSLIYDSGDKMEQLFAALYPNNFNASSTNNTKKNRSDDKGPEPEGLTIGQIGDSIYAFIGVERISGILVYNITNPFNPVFVQHITSRNLAQTPALNMGGDLGPEGLTFIPKSESPIGRNLLVVSNEISGTIATYQIDLQLTPSSNVQLTQHELRNTPVIGTYGNMSFLEGGISGLHYIPGTNNEFYMVGDRGPNVAAENDPQATGTTLFFPFPSYAPKYHHVKAQGDSLLILSTTTLKRPGGADATGIPNPAGVGGTGETAWSDTNATVITPDVWGIDSEGIVEGTNNDLYISEEYGATFWRVDKTTGEVINRYTPYGTSANHIAIDTILKKRVPNRGMEGVAFAPNGKIYTILQSPLANPNTAASDASRLHRLVEFDPATGITRMFAYEHDAPVGGSAGIRNKDWKLGDLVAVNNEEFLVLEHAERNGLNYKNVYKFSIANATPILSENFSGLTFEQLNNSANAIANGIMPVQKTLLLDLLESNWELSHDKPEGLTIIDNTTIAVINDNDFGINSPNSNGQIIATGKTTKMYIYSLPSNMVLNHCVPVTASAASATTICQGDEAALSVPVTAGAAYQWSINGSPISGATASSYNATTSGDYSATITTNSACSANTQSINVNVLPAPSAIVTANSPLTFCQGGSVQLSATQVAGAAYQWEMNGNAIPGANSSSYTATGSGAYAVTVTGTNACASASPVSTVTVNALPNATVATVGSPNFCQGDSVVLAANNTGNIYQWLMNGSPVTGATTANYIALNSGSYEAIITDANSCTDTSAAVAVNVMPLPSNTTLNVNGPLTFCQGGNVVLDITPAAGQSYLWYMNGNPVNWAVTSTYAANASGTYYAEITDANGCAAMTSQAAVTVNPLPSATIIANGSLVFCAGDSVQLNVSSPNAVSYQWQMNNTGISNAAGSSYNVLSSGNYHAVVTNAQGCSAPSSNSIQVTVNPAPAAPTVTANGGSLTSSPASGYQWNFNGSPVAGASSQTYNASITGNYSVTIMDVNGCTATSNSVFVNITGIEGQAALQGLGAYPNPYSGSTNIQLNIAENAFVNVEVFNSVGMKVAELQNGSLDAGQHEYSFSAASSGMSAGIYFARVTVNNRSYTLRLIEVY